MPIQQRPIPTHNFYIYKGDVLSESLPAYQLDDGEYLDTSEGTLSAVLEGDSGFNYVEFDDDDFDRMEDKSLRMTKTHNDAGLQSIAVGGVVFGNVIYTHSDGEPYTIHELRMEVKLRRE